MKYFAAFVTVLNVNGITYCVFIACITLLKFNLCATCAYMRTTSNIFLLHDSLLKILHSEN